MRTNLKVFRVKQNMSQEEIARKIGYTRAAYAAIEAGTREGKQAFWKSFQNAFKIPDSDMWEMMKDEK